MLNAEKLFKDLKTSLERKKTELSEAKGHLNSVKQMSKEEFGTCEIQDLSNLEKKYTKQLEALNSQIDVLESELEQLLDQIEDQ